MLKFIYKFKSNTSRISDRFPAFILSAAIFGTALVFASACFLIGTVGLSSLPLAAAAILLIPAVMIGCSIFGTRPFAVFGLVYCIPLPLMHHFVYRPNIGAADGIAVQLIDLWIIWLIIDYAYQHQNRTVKRIHGFGAFCVPLIVLLVADCLSLVNSADIQLSIYGVIEHLRAAVLFVVLALTLAQGKKELHAAYCAIVCSVATIGAICIGEMMLQANIRSSVLTNGMSNVIFRSGGLEGPTGTAGYLAALLPLVAIEYFLPFSRSRKVLAGVALCLGIAGLGCTLTRSAIGILAFGSIPLLIFLCRHRLIRARHIILCFVGLGLLWASLGGKIYARLDKGAGSLNGRVPLMGTALSMASNSPIFGEGINNYAIKMDSFIPPGQRQKFEYLVHNKFLLTVAETGLLGFTAFIWLLVIAFCRTFLLVRRGLPMGVGLLCSMIVVVLDMNVESYEAGMILLNAWILIAIVAALWSTQFVKARRGTMHLDNKLLDPLSRASVSQIPTAAIDGEFVSIDRKRALRTIAVLSSHGFRGARWRKESI